MEHRIEQLMQGAQEPSSFLQWQRETLEKDRLEKLPIIEQKHQDACLSAEKIALARKQILERNQRAAQLNKEEVGARDLTTTTILNSDRRLHISLKHVKTMITSSTTSSVLYKPSLKNDLRLCVENMFCMVALSLSRQFG